MIIRMFIAITMLFSISRLQADISEEYTHKSFCEMLEEAEINGDHEEAAALKNFIAEINLRDNGFYEDELADIDYLAKNLKEEDFLPDNHPAKSTLDSIFSKPGVLGSIASLKKAGFINPVERKLRGIVVGFHPQLTGFLLKMYLDSRPVDELDKWYKRIDGARLIQKTIDKYGYNSIMKVPKKWLYKLPETGTKKDKTGAPAKKQYILVVEDMDIYSDSETWKNYRTMVEPYHLEALYNLLVDCKLIDSTWIMNIPFAHDGRIAFVDTEFAGKSLTIWGRLPNLAKYLSNAMADYWLDLIDRRSHEKKGDFEEVRCFEPKVAA